MVDDVLNAVRDEYVGNTLGDDHRFLDSDTIASTTEVNKDGSPVRYRLKGIDAPETTKYLTKGVKPGTAGSERANAALQSLAKKQGFTNVVKTGQLDKFGREIVDLKNDKGQSWEETVLRANILRPTKYSSNDAIDAYKTGLMLGTGGMDDSYSVARNAVAEAIFDETRFEERLKRLAIDETQLAYGGKYFAPGNVMFRDTSKGFDNKATSPFSTAWDVGLTGAIEGMYGAAELIGETTGWDWAKNVGEAGIYRAREKLSRMPEIVTTYKDINGFFGKEGFLQYVANNAAISLPYMAATISGAVAAPYVGASLVGVAATGAVLSPVALYSGTIWNDQEGENKNAFLAVAGGVSQSILDRVGLKFLSKQALLTEKGRKEVIDAIIDPERQTENLRRFGTEITTEQAAKDLILTLGRKETAKLMDDAAAFAAKQITSRNVARSMVKRIAVGGAGEGGTEALQEAIGYTAAHTADGFRDWNAEEFVDRLTDATIAGTTLGTSFSVPGGIWDYGAWYDVQYGLSPDTGRQISKQGMKAEQDIRNNNNRQYNIQEVNEQLRLTTQRQQIELDSLQEMLAANRVPQRDRAAVIRRIEELRGTDINDRSEKFEESQEHRTAPKVLKDWWRSLPRLWRGQTRSAFDNGGGIQDDSFTARQLAEGLQGNLERSYTGSSYENRKHHEITKLRNKFGSVDEILALFGRTDRRSSRQEFSKIYYDAFRDAKAAADAEGRAINWDTDLPESLRPQANAFRALYNKLETLGDELHRMQSLHSPRLGRIENYLSRKKTLDKLAIENDRKGFEAALVNTAGVNAAQAKAITDSILIQDGVDLPSNFIPEGGFSVTSKFTFKPQSHKRRTLDLADNAAFDKFMENDLFTNVSNSAKSAVRYSALEEFVGSKNEKINARLNKIQEELMESGNWTAEKAEARVNKLAFDMKNYFDAESGNYKRINIPPILQWAQKNTIFATTITSLPLSTISNLPEMAMTTAGLSADQIFGKKGSINSIARSFVDEVNNTASRMFGTLTNKPTPHKRSEGGHAVAKDLGFFDFEVGAAHTTGVSETGRWHQRILDMFFKGILLQQWTNAVRATRAGIAADYVADHLSVAVANRTAGVRTNESVAAEERLRNLGYDVEFMIKYHQDEANRVRISEADRNYWAEQNREGFFNFVNDAIALPQSANRPLIFQDPRFALFTQFQGFIATFTANHIPKMYGQVVKRGTPGMRYSLFATLSTMIVLGFVSQHLKDLLKYGETTPYFKGMEYFRRGVGASGLLGTSERAIDFVFPMYDKRYQTNVGWFFGTLADESAGISKAVRIADLSFDVATGQKPAEQLVKISPLTQALQQQYKVLPEWNFGE